jgi:hypothetical protein
MPQVERQDELAARITVERELGVVLAFTDLNGDVDYRFTFDGSVAALEVVRFTDPEAKEGSAAWARGNQVYQAPRLRSSWWVVTTGHPHYAELRQHIESALQHLETHHIQYFDEHLTTFWMRQVPTLDEALEVFAQGKVNAARPWPLSSKPATIHLSVSGGWMSDGAKGALEEIENYLASDRTADVRSKLGAQRVDERHVWVWTDPFTDGRVRHPLEDPDGRGQLPARRPELPAEITQLWVVDEFTASGWHWSDPNGWRWVRDATTVLSFAV